MATLLKRGLESTINSIGNFLLILNGAGRGEEGVFLNTQELTTLYPWQLLHVLLCFIQLDQRHGSHNIIY